VPTKQRRENEFIKWFLSAYENHSWGDAKILWLDEITDGAVEALAIRNSDCKTLAIEHTIIEPFVKEKEDFAFFKAAFLKIEKDTALAVPGRWIRVFIPVGTLRGQPKQPAREAIIEAVRSWIKTNRLFLADGFSEHPCPIALRGKRPLDVTLYVKVVPLPGPGALHVRRQQMESNLGKVIEKALKKKLPKLVRTDAHKRLLILERQHMNLHPNSILDEVEKLKSTFRDLALVHEIWLLETMFYGTDFGGSYLRFERYENSTLVGSLDFQGPNLLDKFENGVFELGSTMAPTKPSP